MLVPNYYKEFRCIGPDCEDTCCSVWNITFDRDLYDRFKSNQHPLLGKMFQLQVLQNENPTANASSFGVLQRRADGTCTFHGDDKLCLIHKTLGEDWLPRVCATYPRSVATMNNMPEASLSVSCPEAARLVLKQREPIRFQQQDDDVRLIEAPYLNMDFSNSQISRWVYEIRALCIGILQCRKYPIDARLILLGEFLIAADSLVKSGNEAQFPELLANIRAYLGDAQDYMAVFSTYPANLAFNLNVLATSLIHVFERVNHPNFRIFVADCIKGLGFMNIADDAASDIHETNYRAALHRSEELLTLNAHVLENYLVNHAVSGLFPFGAGVCDRMFDHYRGLVVNYCVIKFVLVGLAASGAEISEPDMIAVIQSFSRWADHAPSELFALHQMLANRGWDSFSATTMLLRED